MQKIINWWQAVKLKSHVALELELPFMDKHIRKKEKKKILQKSGRLA